MNRKYYKALVILIATVIAIFLLSCADNNAISTRAINTPTKIKVSTPTTTPFPKISIGTVQVSSLNIRSGPGTNYGVVGSMKQGDEFYILADMKNSDNKTWFLIPLPNNSFGWVIGEPSYVTDEWVTVDYTTYQTVAEAGRRAKLIYDTTPTTLITPPQIINTQRPAPEQSILFCSDTNNYIGEIITCKIPRAYCSYQSTTSGRPTFCNDAQYPNHNFTLVVWGTDWSDLDRLCIIVSGRVSLFDGKPQIEATNRSQVTYCN